MKKCFLFKNLVTILIAVAACPFAGTAGTQAKQAGRGQARPARAVKSSPAFNDLARRAAEAREADRIEEAISLYRQALQLRADWEEGLWYLGTLLYDRDRYGEALEPLRRLIARQPKNAPAWALAGLCEFQTREYEKALRNLQRARELGLAANTELRSVARYHAALLLTRFEQYELGFEALREFARENKESPSIVEAMGINVLRMPFLPAEVPPDKREQVLLAGRAAYEMAARHVENARKQFQELLARYPQAPNIHYAYGVFLLTENADAAVEEFRRELQISPAHVPALLQMAFEYLKRGDNQAGLPYAEEAVRLAPKMFAARNALGRILLELGDVARAVNELELGVKLAPDSPEMHFALARAYARAGRKAEATRERATFTRLDKIARTLREGAQAVGGTEARQEQKPPE